ncbi:MAG: hypothetical protein ACE37F_16465 [Nannocystaceae bacterium]|nr:hypothetical protein [bacterium]
MTCEGEGDAVEDVEFFALELDDVFGATFLGWHDCTSATSCDESSLLTRSFIYEGGQWSLRSTFAAGIDDCEGSIEEGTLVETDDGVEIEIRTFSGTIELDSGQECDPDLVDAHADALECSSVERIRGTSV